LVKKVDDKHDTKNGCKETYPFKLKTAIQATEITEHTEKLAVSYLSLILPKGA
jgi:hypothetical protein